MEAAQILVEAGAQALISFGLAGGLLPGLKPGAVLIPSTIIHAAHTYSCDSQLMEFLGGATPGAMLAGQKIAATALAKTQLYQYSHAIAVDLESGSVAKAAEDHHLPFAVLRAVADPAERDLPPAAMVALREDGSLDIIRLTRSIAKRPWQIPGLMAVGRDAKAARRALLERLKMLPAEL